MCVQILCDWQQGVSLVQKIYAKCSLPCCICWKFHCRHPCTCFWQVKFKHNLCLCILGLKCHLDEFWLGSAFQCTISSMGFEVCHTLELSLSQLEFWSGVGCFAYKTFMFGACLVGVEVWAKHCLYQFIEDQTNYVMSRGAEMSLVHNEPT